MTTPLRKVVIRETVVSLIINILIGGFLTWKTLPKVDMLPLIGGPESGGFGLFPASILFTFFATLIVTTVIKKQHAAGKIDLGNQTITSWLPKNTLLLALTLVLFFAVIVAPLTLFLAKTLYGAQWLYSHALILNLVYLIAITLIIIPIVVRCAVRTS